MVVAEAYRNSGLPARLISAVVMLLVAGAALWLGGWLWIGFVALVGLGVLAEWSALVFGFVRSPMGRGFWLAGGLAYVGTASIGLIYLRTASPQDDIGVQWVLMLVLPVIATDIGAYLAGRTIGGPKIAPRISPSKTWAGLVGGIIAAALIAMAIVYVIADVIVVREIVGYALVAALMAVIAQAGDFFESWMKRRAGVKDSGSLIPGHGGLFDRVDGLLAVLFVFGGIMLTGAVTNL